MSLNHYSPAPSQILFIDEAYLKATQPLSKNIDAEIIIPSIRDAQDKYILPIIGSGIFEEIKNQITGGTLSQTNTTLLNRFICPILSQYAMYEFTPFLVWQFQNKGMLKRTSEFSEAPSKDDLIFIMAKFKDTGEFYAQRCTDYLRENQDIYPLYNNPGSGIDVYYSNNSSYFGGIHIPSNRPGNNVNPTGWGLNGSDLLGLIGVWGSNK